MTTVSCEKQIQLCVEGNDLLASDCEQQQRKAAIRRKSPKLIRSYNVRSYSLEVDDGNVCGIDEETDGANRAKAEENPVTKKELTNDKSSTRQTAVDSPKPTIICSEISYHEENVETADYHDALANVFNFSEKLTINNNTLPFYKDRVREKTDPFQFFEVKHDPCHYLTAKVLRGRNISKGRFGDMFDVPDPYVVIHIRTAPDGKKATRNIDNNTNPVWNETLTYFLPSDEDVKITAEITLMDANLTIDEELGSIEVNISKIPLEQTVLKTYSFNETSEVDIEFRKEVRYDSDLRSSLALCDEEKAFRSARKRKVFNSMRNLLAKHGRNGGPRTMREAPVISVLGSGGGFRAMTGYAGAMKALHDSGILDCCMYATGLSGSSWYLAALYAHEDFPKKGTDAVNAEIRSYIANSPFWLLRPECLMRYSHRLHVKMKAGQPVTFTDLFGMLIGQTLLGAEKMNTVKLSSFQEKLKDGGVPMPMMSCLHVRPKTSAMTFHDWVEFSPYEIGIAKYATFMKTKHFGSKFYMGLLAKQFDESPLHFLMGVWGSAFSILFNRLVEKSKGISQDANRNCDIRQEMTNELEQTMNQKDDGDESDDETGLDDSTDSEFEDAVQQPLPSQKSSKWFSNYTMASPKTKRKFEKKGGIISSLFGWNNTSVDEVDYKPEKPKPSKSLGFFNSLIGNVFGANIMESREYRAGKILNYMRGVSLSQPQYPISPFTPFNSDTENTIAERNEFEKIHEPIEVKRKKVHIVDAGLTFNSPYPPMLRPQRAVDIILSFDFSARPSENCEPFKEILLAEKWAKIHHLPFPKIDRSVYEREGMKECYVFRDEENERAPIILHFVLCNIQFRKFKHPGVPRAAGDKSGDFDIFDAPKTPYSTFNFQYSHEQFDRLHDLVKFNTRLHIETIIDEIVYCVNLRRHSLIRGSITLHDVRNSVHLSSKNKKSLESNLRQSGGTIHLD